MVLTSDPDVLMAHSRDASGLELVPESVARPSSADEVVEIVSFAAGSASSVTVAGSQTSMTGASISDSGILMSMVGMKRIIDVDPQRGVARVEPGVTIGDLNRALRSTGLQFAPDPTSENEATIGGAIACNASGARSLRHGATRRHVRGVSVVGADGKVTWYRRSYLEKNTVGLAAVQDPVDWFVGSEGTLGIVVEAELSLSPLPSNLVGLAIPFAGDRDALSFVVAARESSLRPYCLEYFDAQALGIAGTASGRPWGESAKAMIYLEADSGAASTDRMLESWLEVSDAHGASTADIRVFEGAQALREARTMRHAVPATMNERGDRHRANGGRKISTDWSVPYPLLGRALDSSSEAVRRHGAPEPVTYGHAGNGHPHQNFIAEDADAIRRTYAAVEDTLNDVFALGGTFSAEHGIGKLKRDWLPRQLGTEQMNVMRAIKHALDPGGIFAPGNLL